MSNKYKEKRTQPLRYVWKKTKYIEIKYMPKHIHCRIGPAARSPIYTDIHIGWTLQYRMNRRFSTHARWQQWVWIQTANVLKFTVKLSSNRVYSYISFADTLRIWLKLNHNYLRSLLVIHVELLHWLGQFSQKRLVQICLFNN